MTDVIDPELLQKARKALDKCKIALMRSPKASFITTIFLGLKHGFDESFPTAKTNGIYCDFNPTWFLSLSPNQQAGLCLHEAWHVGLMQVCRSRVGARDLKLWRIASDYVVNLLVTEAGFEIPEGGYLDQRFKGMSTEQVYDILKQEMPNPPPSQPMMGGIGEDLDTDSGGDKGDKDSGGETPQQAQAREQQIRASIIRANVMAKMAGGDPGQIPAEIQIFLDQFLTPTLPFATRLRRYFTSYSKNEHSWRKPNRRFFPDYYLPSRYSETLESFACAVDASSSVSNEDFHRLVSEIRGAMISCKPKTTTLLQFNTRITAEDQIHDLNELRKVNFIGRGGTSVRPVMEWAKEHKPKLLLVFSDGEFHFPDDLDPGVPVLWVIYNKPQFTASFGDVMHFTID